LNRRPSALIIFFTVAIVYLICSPGRTGSNEHVIQAWAILHGRSYINPIQIHESVTMNGKAFTLHPPLAAFVMMPLVAIQGLNADQRFVSILLAALSVVLMYRLTESLWLTAFYAFGTPLFYEGVLGASWGFALILSTVPTLLAMKEIEKRRRGWRVGFFAGMAALARYDLALVWPVYAAIIQFSRAPSDEKSEEGSNKQRRQCLHFLLGLLPAILAYVAWSYIRFGSFTDRSLWLWWATDRYRAPHPGQPNGPFSLMYLPWNLYSAVFMGPLFSTHFPWVRPWAEGQGLIFTSPALLLALRASWRQRETWLLWAAVGLGMAACLTVYSNGQVQFGCRYWIQVLPFLLLLIHRGGELDQMGKGLIVASILLMAYGMLVIRFYGLVGPII